MTIKNKRKARVMALQAMYAYDIRDGDDIVGIFDTMILNAPDSSEKNENSEYARALVLKTVACCGEIDALIQKHAANWILKRMAVIDRNILRLAIAELRFFQDIPFRVVIDEAVEIAKIFGTDESGKFVNGVIDAVYKEMSVT
jgi:N utilization substance protein B